MGADDKKPFQGTMTANELIVDWLLRGAIIYSSPTQAVAEAQQRLVALARGVDSALVDAHPFFNVKDS